MTGFMMHFEWPDAVRGGDPSSHALDAENLDMAKMEASVVYAGASFQRIPPEAYRIEGAGGAVLYRFPERVWATR